MAYNERQTAADREERHATIDYVAMCASFRHLTGKGVSWSINVSSVLSSNQRTVCTKFCCSLKLLIVCLLSCWSVSFFWSSFVTEATLHQLWIGDSVSLACVNKRWSLRHRFNFASANAFLVDMFNALFKLRSIYGRYGRLNEACVAGKLYLAQIWHTTVRLVSYLMFW